jgi:hypothetical protein
VDGQFRSLAPSRESCRQWPVPRYSRRSSVTERGDVFSEAVVHRPAMPAGIKGRPHVCCSRRRTHAPDPQPPSDPPVSLSRRSLSVRGRRWPWSRDITWCVDGPAAVEDPSSIALSDPHLVDCWHPPPFGTGLKACTKCRPNQNFSETPCKAHAREQAAEYRSLVARCRCRRQEPVPSG